MLSEIAERNRLAQTLFYCERGISTGNLLNVHDMVPVVMQIHFWTASTKMVMRGENTPIANETRATQGLD